MGQGIAGPANQNLQFIQIQLQRNCQRQRRRFTRPVILLNPNLGKQFPVKIRSFINLRITHSSLVDHPQQRFRKRFLMLSDQLFKQARIHRPHFRFSIKFIRWSLSLFLLFKKTCFFRRNICKFFVFFQLCFNGRDEVLHFRKNMTCFFSRKRLNVMILNITTDSVD